jgi:hypothetical protein
MMISYFLFSDHYYCDMSTKTNVYKHVQTDLDQNLCYSRPKREADHSPPSGAEVKNVWSYTSTPQYVFMAWCLLKHKDNFTFTLPYLGRSNSMRMLFHNFHLCHRNFVKCKAADVSLHGTSVLCSSI